MSVILCYLSIAGSMESLAQRAIFHCGGLEEGVTFILYFWCYLQYSDSINSYKLSIILINISFLNALIIRSFFGAVSVLDNSLTITS